VTGLLEGVSPGLALVRGYEPRFAAAEARDIELAWQVGAAAQAALRTVPTWPAAESRRRLEQAARVTVRPLAGETEEAKELAELWAERGDPLLTSVRRARLAWLTAQVGAVHPFYRNAAVSLGRAWQAMERGDEKAWTVAVAEWRGDLATGRELEDASTRLLDAAGRAGEGAAGA
jgi:hypothetical protein